jgi:hypothetical protein
MGRIFRVLAAPALLAASGMPTSAFADHKPGHPSSPKSAAEFAPGQNKAPGESAKDQAPGQMMKLYACAVAHGASCFAPGHLKKVSPD